MLSQWKLERSWEFFCFLFFFLRIPVLEVRFTCSSGMCLHREREKGMEGPQHRTQQRGKCTLVRTEPLGLDFCVDRDLQEADEECVGKVMCAKSCVSLWASIPHQPVVSVVGPSVNRASSELARTKQPGSSASRAPEAIHALQPLRWSASCLNCFSWSPLPLPTVS